MLPTGLNRRTLKKINYYPTPEEILKKTTTNHWPYISEKKELYQLRDNALVAILYNGALRISEARRLKKSQFIERAGKLSILGVELSKSQKVSKTTGLVITRKDLYRKEVLMPSKGARGELTGFLIKYLAFLGEKDRLFPIGNTRMEQIINLKIGVPPHWLRAFGENHLYELWDYDLIAVANYVQVDPRTLAKYIHRVPKKYLKRE